MKRRLLFLGSVCLLLSPSFSLADGPKHVCEGLLRTFTMVGGLERRCHLPNTYSLNVLSVYHTKSCDDFLDDSEREAIMKSETERLFASYGSETMSAESPFFLSPQACSMVRDIERHSLIGGVQ